MIHFSTGEVAKLLGISKRTIQNWIRTKKIPHPTRADNGYFMWTSTDIRNAQEYKTSLMASTRYQIGERFDAKTPDTKL
jgi:DNA-binding transcriptional MerR regulator